MICIGAVDVIAVRIVIESLTGNVCELIIAKT